MTKKNKQPHSKILIWICLILFILLIISVTINLILFNKTQSAESRSSIETVASSHSQTETQLSEENSTETLLNISEAEKYLQKMSLEEKVAQLFMLTPEALTGYNTVITAGDATRDAINQYPVGGLIYFSQNLRNPSQVQTMAAHIACPNITQSDVPSTLSDIMLTDILRNQLGYTGLIMTDSLSMGAIVNQYTSAGAAVAAINTGADILLMPENFQEAYNGILEAIHNGTISEQRINDSVLRIIQLKLTL